jgi:hypothetical protein
MMKNLLKYSVLLAGGAWLAASSQAALLVDLNAANSGSNSLWVSSGGSFPGWYEDDDQLGAPVKETDVNGVTYFSTRNDNGCCNGFFGGDDSGGTQQHPSGNEPQFVLNGTNPGDFTLELWLRKRGNRIGADHKIFGMKSPSGDERLTLFLRDSGEGDAESLIDFNMRSSGSGTSVLLLDQHGLPNRSGTDAFTHLVMTWDNSAASMDVFDDGVLATNLMFAGVSFSALTVFGGTTIFYDFVNDSGGTRRFNGDIARVRIHDEILSLDNIVDNFLLGPNGVAGPIHTDDITIDDVAVLQYTSEVGRLYNLEFTTDLISSSVWQRAGANIVGDGGVQFLYDPAGSDTNKAYRVVTE